METFYMLVLGQELVSFFSQNTIESLTHVGFKIFHVVQEKFRHLPHKKSGEFTKK